MKLYEVCIEQEYAEATTVAIALSEKKRISRNAEMDRGLWWCSFCIWSRNNRLKRTLVRFSPGRIVKKFTDEKHRKT